MNDLSVKKVVKQANHPFGVILQAEQGSALFDLDPQALEQLILDEGLVLLRGFAPTSDDQMSRFARQFGELLQWDFGHVLDLQIKPNPDNHIFSQGRVELHWDGAFASAEPRFNFFQCLQSSAVSGGGETTFLNTVKFLASLPADHKAQLQNLCINYQADKKAHYGGCIETQLINPHPATGADRMQFIEAFNEDNAAVNPVLTTIKDMAQDDSDELLKQIIAWCYQSQYFYDHRWQTGDYLLVDNHALLHGRRRFQGSGLNRALKRIHIL